MNDGLSLLLRATNEAFKNIGMYSDTIKKLDGLIARDDRTNEEIVEDVLNKFKR